MSNTIGVPKEIKDDEGRVALSPAGVDDLVQKGHAVLVECGAGVMSGFDDAEYEMAGARIVGTAAEAYSEAEIIVKVKEPLELEFPLIRAGQILFTFFHFAANRELTEVMVDLGATCVAYETIETDDGRLPLLTPMSEVAGRMAVFEGSKCLESPLGGRGVLISGIPGVEPARVIILGGGVVGLNAAKLAAGLGAQVTIFDIDLERLRYLSDVLPSNVITLYSSPYAIREKVHQADLVIGAVLVPGRKAPILVVEADLAEMRDGSVIIDVAVDQGGSVESCRPTTHSAPTYKVSGVLHYCVANMPGALPRTSTLALTNATFPYLKALATDGLTSFFELGPGARRGVNVHAGKIYHEGVASAFDMNSHSINNLQLA